MVKELKSVKEFSDEDLVVCQHCACVFIKSLREIEENFWDGRGIFCPTCKSLVVAMPEKEPQQESKEKDEESWFN